MKMSNLWYKAVGTVAALPLLPVFAIADAIVVPGRATREYDITPHEHWEEVFHEVMLDITVIGVIFAVIAAYFAVAYTRKSPDEVGESVELSPQATLGWVLIPVFLFMADDFYLFAAGWDLHNHYREVPADAYEVKVTGAMWSWTYGYGDNGEDVESYDGLVVPVATPILLRMTSEDVIHSHFMRHFHVTEDMMPGRLTYQWFYPDEVGEYIVSCREYCGNGHSNMYTKVIVKTKADFNAWIENEGGEGIALDEAVNNGEVAGIKPVAAPSI
ncbi:MAG: cytochrome c oxidase subunit II [Mariprofundales bacterium]